MENCDRRETESVLLIAGCSTAGRRRRQSDWDHSLDRSSSAGVELPLSQVHQGDRQWL